MPSTAPYADGTRVLHIGPHKTGTTGLQRAFWASRDLLTEHGVLWAGGEIVSVTMLGILVLQWIRQSEREARRIDRALDRAEQAEAAAPPDRPVRYDQHAPD